MDIIYTQHAKERMLKRKITEEEIKEAIRYPNKISKKNNKYIIQKDIQRAKIEIIYEKDKYIKVITIYYI